MSTVDNPACDCCPHTELSDLERDALTRAVWDGCPDSGCLREFCPTCSAPCMGYTDVLWANVPCPWQAKAVEHGRCQACNGKQMIESNCRGW